jgi:hypothetical protein
MSTETEPKETDPKKFYEKSRVHDLEQFDRIMKGPPTATKETLSPSGKYKLTTQSYKTGEHTWNYSRGVVTEVATGKQVGDVRRNYGSFWHTWLERKDGTYLLCGEDYQGYGYVHCEAATQQFYYPRNILSGSGWCWGAAYVSPSGQFLLVAGCYWACPWEMRLLDLRGSMELPFTCLKTFSDTPSDDFKRWRRDDGFVGLILGTEVLKADGRLLGALSSEDEDKVIDEKWETMTAEYQFNWFPTISFDLEGYLENARALDHWRRNGDPDWEDAQIQMKRLWPNLTPEQRREIPEIHLLKEVP